MQSKHYNWVGVGHNSACNCGGTQWKNRMGTSNFTYMNNYPFAIQIKHYMYG